MKKLSRISILIIITSLVIGQITLHSQEETVAADKAKRVLEQYFYSIKNGDSSEILNLITGPLLKKRERLLRYNTHYGIFLQEKYENAQFSIVGQQPINKDKLALDVQIIFNNQDVRKTRFVLVQSNRLIKILSEEEIPNKVK